MRDYKSTIEIPLYPEWIYIPHKEKPNKYHYAGYWTNIGQWFIYYNLETKRIIYREVINESGRYFWYDRPGQFKLDKQDPIKTLNSLDLESYFMEKLL